MGRKRKAGNGGKMANEGETPTSETTNDKEIQQAATGHTVLESKEVENNVHSLTNGLSPEHVSHVEHIVESENIVEKGKEEVNHHQQVGAEPNLDERNMEQKVCRTTNDDPSAELSYRSMYISSQKKIENLMAENCRLTMKLEFARGKLEVYERMIDAIRTTKDVILIDSTRGKTSETAIGNLNSAPEADHREKSPEADHREKSPEKDDSENASDIANKRKKVYQLRKKNC